MKPSIAFRAAIYMVLAGLPVFIAFFVDLVKKVDGGTPIAVHWAVWWLLALNAAYQMVLALRIYLDGSAERSRQKTEETDRWKKDTGP